MWRFLLGLCWLGFLGLFAWRGQQFISANSQTFDEAVYLTAGYSYWSKNDFRLGIEQPPLQLLYWSLPIYLFEQIPFEPDPQMWEQADEWQIGRQFLYESSVPFAKLLSIGRWMNWSLGGLLILLIAWWGYRLAGPYASILAAGLVSLDPNLLAHSCILSTDVGLTLFSTASLYCLWEFQSRPSLAWLHVLGLMLGFTLASKFSAVFVVFNFAVLIAVLVWFGGTFRMPGESSTGISWKERISLAPFVRVGLIALMVLVVCYFGIHFPVFGKGFKQQLLRNTFDPPSFYLMGEVSSRGWWYYFLVTLACKVPLASSLLILVALVGSLFPSRCPKQAVLFLLLPAFFFFLWMLLAHVNLGIRIILPMVPLLYLFTASWLAASTHSLHKILGLSLLVFVFFSTQRSMPHALTYFSEWVAEDQKASYLGDSNLDWGQDLYQLKKWMDQEQVPMVYLSYAGTAPPRHYGIRYQHLPSWGFLEIPPKDQVPTDAARPILAISVSNLQGIYLEEKTHYRWLWEYTPTAKLGGAIWIYELNAIPDFQKKLGLPTE